MTIKSVALLVCHSLVCVLLIACSAPTAPTATPAPTLPPLPTVPLQLEVIPHTIRPGMRATFIGLGFQRGEQVSFYLIRPDGTKTGAGNSTADQSGGAAYELDVMDDWQPGEYTARVQSRANPSRGAEEKVKFVKR